MIENGVAQPINVQTFLAILAAVGSLIGSFGFGVRWLVSQFRAIQLEFAAIHERNEKQHQEEVQMVFDNMKAMVDVIRQERRT